MCRIMIRETDATDPGLWMADRAVRESGLVELMWTGQAGFILRSPEGSLAIDLYLSDSLAEKYSGTELPHVRMHPAPLCARELRSVDLLLCSHGHTDHMDGESLGEIYDRMGSRPVCIAPRGEAPKALQRNIPQARLLGLDAQESFSLREGQISITAIPAAHEQLLTDEYGNHMALGYIIRLGGLTFYHSGDCIPYDGLEELLIPYQVDVALLPVNGRDPYRTSRGILGNFTIEEACELTRRIGARLLIPHHFGMFDFNTVSEGHIREECSAAGLTENVQYRICEVGRVYQLGVYSSHVPSNEEL